MRLMANKGCRIKIKPLIPESTFDKLRGKIVKK
jgi:hypothetical protein